MASVADRSWDFAPPAPARKLAVFLVLAATLGGLLASSLVTGGHFLYLFFLAALFLPLVFWRVPKSGAVFLVASATLIEQFNNLPSQVLTAKIPLFVSLQAGLQVPGVFLNPMELLLALLIAAWLLRSGSQRTIDVPRSALSASLLLMIIVVLAAEFWGVARGGDTTYSFWEVRPWLYLAASYLIVVAVVRDRQSRSAVLWAFAIGTSIKAVQGVFAWWPTRNLAVPPEAILAHEEAFFMGLFIVLTVLLWVFGERGRLRTFCTVMAPVVIFTDLVNDRRTAWLIVGAGVVLVVLFAWIRFSERRGRIAAGFAIGLFVAIVYGAALWNSDNTLAQPVRAFRSAVAPSERDQQSNQYRNLEDRTLQLNILDSFPFGTGFGVRIDYKVPIVDLSATNPLIKYVPHDGVLYVWMKMGIQGFFIFWCMVAAAVLAACRLVRSPDRQAVIIGVLTVAAVAAYLIQGTYDYGLFWFRIAILMGVLFGLVETLDPSPRKPAPAERTATVPTVRVRALASDGAPRHGRGGIPRPGLTRRKLRR